MTTEHPPDLADIPYEVILQDPTLFSEYQEPLQLAARAGDVEAFGVLAAVYRPALEARASRELLGTNLERKIGEVVDSAISKIFTALATKPQAERPFPRFPYFASAVRSLIKDEWKAESRHGTVLDDFLTTADPEEGEGSRDKKTIAAALLLPSNRQETIYLDGDRVFEHLVAVEALEAIKRRLSDEQWELIQLRFVDGLSIEEIAERMRLNLRAVTSRFGRIFEKVKRLEEAGIIERPDSAKGKSLR